MWYTFEILKGKNKGQQFDIELPSSELEAYIKVNEGKLQQIFKMSIGDPIKLGIKRPPACFQKYVLDRIKSSVPGAKVEKRWNITKEI